MSYDLLVFDSEVAPKEPIAFKAWFIALAAWDEGHDYDDPANTSETLRAWYREMIQDFPAMNGPDQPTDESAFDSDRITGYSCAKRAIYVDFRWSAAEAAYRSVVELARKHKLGFFDVSGSGEVWGPVDGGYRLFFVVGDT